MLKLIERETIVKDKIRQKFQCDIAPELFVPRQPNNTHPAATEDFLEQVASENMLPGG